MVQEVMPIPKTMKMIKSTRMRVMRVRRFFGKSERVRVHKDLPRSTKQWQFKLLLLLSLRLQFKNLPLGMLVTSLGATGAVTTIVSLAHAARISASAVARRVILCETAEYQINQPIMLP